jgi:hypothetical protein
VAVVSHPVVAPVAVVPHPVVAPVAVVPHPVVAPPVAVVSHPDRVVAPEAPAVGAVLVYAVVV